MRDRTAPPLPPTETVLRANRSLRIAKRSAAAESAKIISPSRQICSKTHNTHVTQEVIPGSMPFRPTHPKQRCALCQKTGSRPIEGSLFQHRAFKIPLAHRSKDEIATTRTRAESKASTTSPKENIPSPVWAHLNCVLWSTDVAESIDRQVLNLDDCLVGSRRRKCTLCGMKGASINCCFAGCSRWYHFECSRISGNLHLPGYFCFCSESHASRQCVMETADSLRPTLRIRPGIWRALSIMHSVHRHVRDKSGNRSGKPISNNDPPFGTDTKKRSRDLGPKSNKKHALKDEPRPIPGAVDIYQEEPATKTISEFLINCHACGHTNERRLPHESPTKNNNGAFDVLAPTPQDVFRSRSPPTLHCVDCGRRYHKSCLPDPVNVSNQMLDQLGTAWRCPQCKLCEACLLEDPMLVHDEDIIVCEDCDRGYHIFCLKPPLSTVPADIWKCNHCLSSKDSEVRELESGNDLTEEEASPDGFATPCDDVNLWKSTAKNNTPENCGEDDLRLRCREKSIDGQQDATKFTMSDLDETRTMRKFLASENPEIDFGRAGMGVSVSTSLPKDPIFGELLGSTFPLLPLSTSSGCAVALSVGSSNHANSATTHRKARKRKSDAETDTVKANPDTSNQRGLRSKRQCTGAVERCSERTPTPAPTPTTVPGIADEATSEIVLSPIVETVSAGKDQAEKDAAENDPAENVAEKDAAENDPAEKDAAEKDAAEKVSAEKDPAEKEKLSDSDHWTSPAANLDSKIESAIVVTKAVSPTSSLAPSEDVAKLEQSAPPKPKNRVQRDKKAKSKESSEHNNDDFQPTKYCAPFLLINSLDDVVYSGDICICGSRGCSISDRLVFCSQCGEGYHEYCAAGVTIDEFISGTVPLQVDDKTVQGKGETDKYSTDEAPDTTGCASGPKTAAVASGGQSKIMISKSQSWRCFNCLFCELCHDAEPEGDLVVCDHCERGFHINCLVPPLHTVPSGKYLCPECVQCTMCGARVPGRSEGSQWKRNYEVCQLCDQREKRQIAKKRKAEQRELLAGSLDPQQNLADDPLSSTKKRKLEGEDQGDGSTAQPCLDSGVSQRQADGEFPPPIGAVPGRVKLITDIGNDGTEHNRIENRTSTDGVPSMADNCISSLGILPRVASLDGADAMKDGSTGSELTPPTGQSSLTGVHKGPANGKLDSASFGRFCGDPSMQLPPIKSQSNAKKTYSDNHCHPSPIEPGGISPRFMMPLPMTPCNTNATIAKSSWPPERHNNGQPSSLWPLQPGQIVFFDNLQHPCKPDVASPYSPYLQSCPMIVPTGLPYAFQYPVPEAYALTQVQYLQAYAYVPYVPSTFGYALGVDGWTDACVKQFRPGTTVQNEDVSKRFSYVSSEHPDAYGYPRPGIVQPGLDAQAKTRPLKSVKVSGQNKRQAKYASLVRSKHLIPPLSEGFFVETQKPTRKIPRKSKREVEIAKAPQIVIKIGPVASVPVPTYYSDTVSYSRRQLFIRRKEIHQHHKSDHSRRPSTSATSDVTSESLFGATLNEVTPLDRRKCALCFQVGDTGLAGRFLYVDVGCWVHALCAFWSDFVVYNPPSGGLDDVVGAIARSKRAKCNHCNLAGASIICFEDNCEQKYHYDCSRKAGCIYLIDKKVYCKDHSLARDTLDHGPTKSLGDLRSVVGSNDGSDLSKHRGSTTSTETRAAPIAAPLSFSATGSPLVAKFTEDLPIRLTIESSSSIPFLNDAVKQYPSAILRFGSILLYNLGFISRSDPYHTDKHIYPVGYKVRRMYWSTLFPSQRCFYTCEIVERDADSEDVGEATTETNNLDDSNPAQSLPVKEIEFVITAEEEEEVPPFVGSSATDAWQNVVARIRTMRANSIYPANGINGEYMFGLSHPSIAEMIEHLPNASMCVDYQFRFKKSSPSADLAVLSTRMSPVGTSTANVATSAASTTVSHARYEAFVTFSPMVTWDRNVANTTYLAMLPENSSGSARCEVRNLRRKKTVEPRAAHGNRSHGIASAANVNGNNNAATTSLVELLQNTYFSSESASAGSEILRSITAKYRQLRKNARLHRVVPSRIAGFGLLAGKNYAKDDMIIEYVGQVIGPKAADRREAVYEAKQRGCYMFAIDKEHIVDATMMGNAARFINHCCDPNCSAKIITIEGSKKIIIFAKKDIEKGEEFTYDYQFDLESADKKIPCMCGASNCQKWMN